MPTPQETGKPAKAAKSEKPEKPEKPTGKTKKGEQVNIRLSPGAKEAIDRIAAHLGVTRTAVVEMSVREYARSRGIEVE